ncbi:MAG: YdiU family protein [Pseudomonadota bacterium]
MFAFDNTFSRCPDRFFARVGPTPVADPALIKLNTGLARQLGLNPDMLSGAAGVSVLSGNDVPDGAAPIAMAYAGHQFGHFNPALGDGRAIVLGEIIDHDGLRRDIQLKGSGPTPFSRRGDGRAAVGPVLREYIISEAMAALGIPTTRALAAVLTGEPVYRERVEPGAVLTRVANGLVRVGTFEFFAARRDTDAIRCLADYVIARHYPDATETDTPYRALLEAVINAQAQLIARWMGVGFIHGVMNTDNMSVAGETIDYGPCAFMDTFDPSTVYSSIDYAGRYAYGNQPRIAQWNLARFAQSLLPVLADDEEVAIGIAQDAINAFPDLYQAAWHEILRAKLGLFEARDGDDALADGLLKMMHDDRLDFTNTFCQLCDMAQSDEDTAGGLEAARSVEFNAWLSQWRTRLGEEPATPDDRALAMRHANPAYIPRNHRVEEVISAAVSEGDFAPFERLLAVLSRPFEDQPENAIFADPPKPDEVVKATFCGT